MSEFVLSRKLGGDHALAGCLGLPDEIGEVMVALRSDHDVDHRRPRHDLRAFRLGDAARDGDQRVAALSLPCFLGKSRAAKLRIDLLGGLLPDVAGVEDDEIRLVLVLRQSVAERAERIRHALAVISVHLAAESLDMQRFGHFFLRGLAPTCLLDTGATLVKGHDLSK